MGRIETTSAFAPGRGSGRRTWGGILSLAGVAGFAIGWMAFASRPGAISPETEARPQSRVAARQVFPLRPADQVADRETPALAVAPDGQVVLAFASQTGEAERTLYLTRSADGGRSFADPEPWRRVPIYRFRSEGKGGRPPMTFSTHVLPRLAAGRETVELGWVEAIDGGPTVAYFVARSVDGGRTFSDPIPVHGGPASRPGFTALASGPDGSVLCGWLDGRNQGQQPFVSTWPEGSAGFGPEQQVWAGPGGQGVCPCCDVAVARVGDGTTFVAFRNNDAGHRDIWLARSPAASQGFESPLPISPNRWAFDGCPHDGPALALSQGRLVLAWMDAHTGRNRVYVTSTSPTDLAFTPPLELAPNSPGSQGHPRLVTDPAGRLHAVWDEALGDEPPAPAGPQHGHSPNAGGDGRTVMYAVSIGDGLEFGPAVPLDPRPGAIQIQPALAVGPDGAVQVAWNELDADGKQVVVVRLDPGNRSDRTGAPQRVGLSAAVDHQSARISAGSLVYRVHCARCHGPSGHGDGPDAPFCQPKPRDLASGSWNHGSTPEAVRRVIAEGLPASSMTAWRGALTDRELDTVTAYVLSLAPEPRGADSLSPGLAAALERAGFSPVLSRPIAPPLGHEGDEGRGGLGLGLGLGPGQLVLVVFWGTSCAPCLEHLPDLERLAERYRDQGLRIRPICVDEPDPETARAVAHRHAPGLRVEVDQTGRARRNYDLQALPVSLLIDGDGRLLGRAEGSPDWSGPEIQKLLTTWFDEASR